MPFNLRPAELILILAIILLIFGAKKLPDLARGIGQSLRIFRKEVKDLTDKDKPGDDDAERETAPTPVAVSQAAPVPAAAAAPAEAAAPAPAVLREPVTAPAAVPVAAGERA